MYEVLTEMKWVQDTGCHYSTRVDRLLEVVGPSLGFDFAT